MPKPEDHSQFLSNSQRQLFGEVLARYENLEFQESKKLEVAGADGNSLELSVFDIDYFGMRLNVLETFDEGEFVLAERLKFIRGYVNDTKDQTMFTHHTKIFDVTLSQYRGSIGMFHGFAQCQDVFFEIALQYALNGFVVHLIDFEGQGYSGGKRISGLTIERMHLQVTSLLTLTDQSIPLFLYGHSMGCLILNTYLS